MSKLSANQRSLCGSVFDFVLRTSNGGCCLVINKKEFVSKFIDQKKKLLIISNAIVAAVVIVSPALSKSKSKSVVAGENTASTTRSRKSTPARDPSINSFHSMRSSAAAQSAASISRSNRQTPSTRRSVSESISASPDLSKYLTNTTHC